MEMKNFGHQSKLRSLTQHSNKRIKLKTGDPELAPYPENNSVDLACSTLREFQKHVGDEPELVRGTKELINFMQNLRISPPGPTADEQLQALYPIRHWVPWLPRSLISLSDREPLVLVFLAHYHMVILAVESILPAAPNFLLASKRVELIERLETAINQVYKPSEKLQKRPGTRDRRESFENLMSGPAAFARQFLLTNLLAEESFPVWEDTQTTNGIRPCSGTNSLERTGSTQASARLCRLGLTGHPCPCDLTVCDNLESSEWLDTNQTDE